MWLSLRNQHESNKAAGISRNGSHMCPSEKDETTESENISGC